MVYFDCGCGCAVYDERRGGSQTVRLLCTRPDEMLQASEGEMLQGTEGEVLQEPLWLELRQSLR